MALVMLLANGFEEIEALGTLDLLRRGGVEVVTCTLNQTPLCLGAHQIAVETELCLTELDSAQFDGVILPGGMGGSTALAQTQGVTALLQSYDEAKKWICAICAAPAVVLAPAGIVRKRKVTCYPADAFIQTLGAQYVDAKAIVDENLITAAGPGRFTDFAYAILEQLKGTAVAKQVFAEALID